MTRPGPFPDWIAADWGTTHLRVWAMSGASQTDAAGSDRGMGKLAPDQFEPALLDLIAPWLGDGVTPVIACGMVGARQGWTEAGYGRVPCGALDAAPVRAPTADPRLAVWILPGLSQADPPDVMRGEETQIAGFLSLNPGFDGVICLPGTYSCMTRCFASSMVRLPVCLRVVVIARGASPPRNKLPVTATAV